GNIVIKRRSPVVLENPFPPHRLWVAQTTVGCTDTIMAPIGMGTPPKNSAFRNLASPQEVGGGDRWRIFICACALAWLLLPRSLPRDYPPPAKVFRYEQC